MLRKTALCEADRWSSPPRLTLRIVPSDRPLDETAAHIREERTLNPNTLPPLPIKPADPRLAHVDWETAEYAIVESRTRALLTGVRCPDRPDEMLETCRTARAIEAALMVRAMVADNASDRAIFSALRRDFGSHVKPWYDEALNAWIATAGACACAFAFVVARKVLPRSTLDATGLSRVYAWLDKRYP